MIKLPPWLLPGRHDLFSGFQLFVALLFLCKNECRYEAHAGCAEQTVPDRQIHCIAGLRSVQLLPLCDVGGVAGYGAGDCGLPACENIALAGRGAACERRRCGAGRKAAVDLILEDLFTLYTVGVSNGVRINAGRCVLINKVEVLGAGVRLTAGYVRGSIYFVSVPVIERLLS